MTLTLAQLASATGGEVSAGQVLAPGPGHKPHDRSLSIKPSVLAPDGFIVYSHAGDDVNQCRDHVRERLGLPTWRPRNGKGIDRSVDDEIDTALAGSPPSAAASAPPPVKAAAKRTLVCNYDYRDLDGNMVYQVQRWEPKAFTQRRSDGKGGWVTAKVFEGIGRVPYQWVELAAEMAAYPDAPVFCTEGEKDCDNVRKLGLFATCAAGSVWTPEIAAVLKDRDVVVLEDNDKAGRDKAAKAGQALHGIARSVRIASFPELPEKGDVSDWIDLDPEQHNADALAMRCCTAPLFNDGQLLGEWDAGDDDTPIPPRGWLLGNIFCRRFISSVIAEGGVGKSALRLAQLLSLAIDRPLTGEHVFQRCRVLIVSLEDNADELRRRLRAACLHHHVTRAELSGWLYLAAPGAGGGKLVTLDLHGRPVLGGLAAKLSRTITERKIDIISLDPFVKAHAVEENSNSMIDEVVQVLADMAGKFDIAVDVPHHAAKGPPDPGNANRGRGASAMKDAGRLIYTLTPMSLEEGQALGLGEADRRRLIRLDSAKVNITPPMAEAKWFRLIGVDIGNGTALYPRGDQVQTVELVAAGHVRRT